MFLFLYINFIGACVTFTAISDELKKEEKMDGFYLSILVFLLWPLALGSVLATILENVTDKK